MTDLKQIAGEILEVIKKYQSDNKLVFTEEDHKYTMTGMPSNAPSVSSIIEIFSHPFIPENTWTFKKLKGDKEKEELLLEEWEMNGFVKASIGSRTHWALEKYVVERYNLNKEVRKPIFECDVENTAVSNAKIKAGMKFIDTMKQRGCYPLDTETVLASNSDECGYFGQCDNFFLFEKPNGKICIVSTDWKTSDEKGFIKQSYHKQMKAPFEDLTDNNLSHYSIQIPLYSKLLKEMLKGSEFEDKIEFCGGIIVRLGEDEEYTEYKIDNKLFKKVMNMNIKQYLPKPIILEQDKYNELAGKNENINKLSEKLDLELK